MPGTTTPITISPPSVDAAVFPIRTMSHEQFFRMSAKDMQDIFRKYPVIVVTGRPTRLRFDLASLEEWGDLDEPRTMHGIFLQIIQHPCVFLITF